MDYRNNDFGTVEFNGKEYALTTDADFTGRQLDYPKNYNDVEDGDEYEFELSASGTNDKGNEVTVYWIFSCTKGNEQELDSFDYDNVDRVEEL